MEITLENVHLNRMCHACLSTEPDIKILTQSNVNYEHFVNIYKMCTSFEPKLETLSFCETCFFRMEEFHMFQEMCLQSHATIQAILTKTNQIVIDEEGEIYELNNNVAEEIKIECDPAINEEEECSNVGASKIMNHFKCITCCENFEDIASLGKHNEMVHCAPDYRCSVCGKIFNGSYLLKKHVRKHKTTKSDDIKMFGCGRCEKSYRVLVNLQNHLYSHLGLRPYKCQFCPKAYTKASELKSHLNTHSGICNYLCAECGKGFASALRLKRHQISHTSSRPFQCKQCPVSFAFPRDLAIHMRTHTGEKPFLCSTCGKAFRRAFHLNVHKRTHTGEKPYKCTYCDRGFAQSGDLRAHERIHTGERPYVCPVCNKKFNQSNGLTMHMKLHNDGRYFKCEFCDKVFSKGGNLKKHLLLHMEAHVIERNELTEFN